MRISLCRNNESAGIFGARMILSLALILPFVLCLVFLGQVAETSQEKYNAKTARIYSDVDKDLMP